MCHTDCRGLKLFRLIGFKLKTACLPLVCAGGDGTRLFVSCLAYYEPLCASLACQHSALLGSRAAKALCLVSAHPYLSTMQAILTQLYAAVFVHGSRLPISDMVAHLLSVPLPVARLPARFSADQQVCVRVVSSVTECARRTIAAASQHRQHTAELYARRVHSICTVQLG
jgi:hypothetical protein